MDWQQAHKGIWDGRRNIGLYGVGMCTDTELDTMLTTIQAMSLAVAPMCFDYGRDVGGLRILGGTYGKFTIWPEYDEDTE
jgi:hypothetical protein